MNCFDLTPHQKQLLRFYLYGDCLCPNISSNEEWNLYSLELISDPGYRSPKLTVIFTQGITFKGLFVLYVITNGKVL
jgi:hypothetical protein